MLTVLPTHETRQTARASDQREERVIAPAADIRTRIDLGAALPDENLTRVRRTGRRNA